MSEKEIKTLGTFEKIFSGLSELEKEKLLSYGEGFAAATRAMGKKEGVENETSMQTMQKI